MAKFDIYEAVTNKVIEALDKGTVPWRKPWSVRNGDNRHRNLVSKRPYRGINQFLLEIVAASEGYSSPYWLSFKQVREKKGTVRKGEKATMVVFWKPIKVETDEVKDGKKVVKTIPILRYYNVFNIEQCDDIKVPVTEEDDAEEFDPIEVAEMTIENMPGRPVLLWGGNRAVYSPIEDAIRLPDKESFKTPEGYYATAFHELGHATGHEDRLNVKGAFGNEFGSDLYAREELRAEMTSAMVCAALTINPDVAQSAAYVRSWLSAADYKKVLGADKKLIIHAAAKAQRAADYILGENQETEEES